MYLDLMHWSPTGRGWLTLTDELVIAAHADNGNHPGWDLDRIQTATTLFGRGLYHVYQRLPAGGPKTPSSSCSVM